MSMFDEWVKELLGGSSLGRTYSSVAEEFQV